jgi:hypothetical protein
MFKGLIKLGMTRRALLQGGATSAIAALATAGAETKAAAQLQRFGRIGGSKRVHIDGVLVRVTGAGGPAAQLVINATVDGPGDAMSGSGWASGVPPILPATPVAPIFFTQAGSSTGSVVKLMGRGLFSSIAGCVGAEIAITADGADGFISFTCMCVDPAIPQWKYEGFGTVVHD